MYIVLYIIILFEDCKYSSNLYKLFLCHSSAFVKQIFLSQHHCPFYLFPLYSCCYPEQFPIWPLTFHLLWLVMLHTSVTVWKIYINYYGAETQYSGRNKFIDTGTLQHVSMSQINENWSLSWMRTDLGCLFFSLIINHRNINMFMLSMKNSATIGMISLFSPDSFLVT